MDTLLYLLPSIFIPDEVMLVISFVLFCVFVWFGKKHENYVVGAMAVSMIFRMVYFAVLAIHWEPLFSKPELRAALARPSEATLAFLLCIFFINGRVNKLIRTTLTRLGLIGHG
jgi:hypothetical protein